MTRAPRTSEAEIALTLVTEHGGDLALETARELKASVNELQAHTDWEQVIEEIEAYLARQPADPFSGLVIPR